MMKLERRVERLERHVATAEELLAEVRARAILKPDYHPDDVAFTPCGPQRVAELEAELEDVRNQRDCVVYECEVFQKRCIELKAQLDELQDKYPSSYQTAAQELMKHRDKLWAERDKLREQLAAVTAERDALQARIDAGVRVRTRYYNLQGQWTEGEVECPTGTALLIDRQPIAQDERKGERRRKKAAWIVGPDSEWAFFRTNKPTGYSRHEGQRDPSGANDRRVTAGTVADREVGK